MCNPQFEANQLSIRLGGGYVEDNFPPQFIQSFHPNMVRYGHCLDCGRFMAHEKMFPYGRTARYMHDYCYEQIVGSGPKYNCLVCGGQLPPRQVQEQMRNPRELSLSLHTGVCKDFHYVLAGIVLGVPFRVRQANPTRMFSLPQTENSFKSFISGINMNQQLIDGRSGRPIRRVTFLKLPE